MKRPSLSLVASTLLFTLSGVATAAPINFFSKSFTDVLSIGGLGETHAKCTPNATPSADCNDVRSAQYSGTDSYTLSFIRFTTNNPATTDPDVSADGVTSNEPSTYANELKVQINRTGVLNATGSVTEWLGDSGAFTTSVFYSAADGTFDADFPADGDTLKLPDLVQLAGASVTDVLDTFFFRFYETTRDNADSDGTPLADATYNYIRFEFWGEPVTSGTPPGGGSVPEPATLALMGLGLIGLGFSRRRLF